MGSHALTEAVAALDPARPVLIAGPTASGKSALAMAIARTQGGLVVNADSLQVYADWRVLTARPTAEDEAAVPHALYGHVPGTRAYSVGNWLREAAPLLERDERPIFTGGTGLYFRALTEGLTEIPEIPAEIRAEAEARLARDGPRIAAQALDAPTRARIDTANPRRVQRALEVLAATGRGLADWQDATPPPLLPLAQTQPVLVTAPKDWLNARIADRLRAMIAGGALDEARANRPGWRTDLPSAKAIGATELMAYLDDRLSLEDATERAIVQTRQFAKRQRTWFRARMGSWPQVDARLLQ
jgi:tRNA dimethylallyltransferase